MTFPDTEDPKLPGAREENLELKDQINQAERIREIRDTENYAGRNPSMARNDINSIFCK